MKKRTINFWVVIIIIFSNLLISNTLLAQTQEEIYKELIRQEVKCPDIVMAQILYETGHLESNRFQVQHNLFGMKLARQRQTTAIGKDKDNFAIYRNWKQSIADYLIWQTKYYKGGNYYEFIKNSGYCPSIDYVPTLKRIKI